MLIYKDTIADPYYSPYKQRCLLAHRTIQNFKALNLMFFSVMPLLLRLKHSAVTF